MPFKSEKQRRYLWSKHPKIARRWTEESGPDPIGRRLYGKRRPRKKGTAR